MPILHTLTVQDMLWVNLQLTKKPEPYNFATLEEATYLQYGHIHSTDIFTQASRFLNKLPVQRPYAVANQATAFVAFVAFLVINDQELTVTDEEASNWLKTNPSAEDIKAKTHEHHHHGKHGVPDTRAAITEALNRFPQTIESLLQNEPQPALF